MGKIRGVYYNSETGTYSADPSFPQSKNVYVPLMTDEPEKELSLFAMFHTKRFKTLSSYTKVTLSDPPFFCGTFPRWCVKFSGDGRWIFASVCGRKEVMYRLIRVSYKHSLSSYLWVFQWLYESLLEISGNETIWCYDRRLTKRYFVGSVPCDSIHDAMRETGMKPSECLIQLSYLLGYGVESDE